MIQVILLILKIIGITLAVLLGLILLVLALVLFVPFCYRVRVVHNPEKTQVDGKVGFLSPLLSVTFRYLEKFTYKGKLFWYVFLDSERPKKEKAKKEKAKKKKKKKKNRKQSGQGTEKTKKSEEKTAKEKPEKKITEETVTEKPAVKKEPEAPEKTMERKPAGDSGEEKTEKKKEEDRPGFFETLRLKIEKIRDTITKIIQKVKKILHLKDEVLGILKKPSSRQALAFAWGKLKQLFKHILPRKIKGYVAYGGKDPAATGQALAILGVVYAKTGPLLEIRPNFEEPQLECEVELKGRIQAATLLVIVVKVLMNPELQELIRDFKNLKEAE